MIATVLLVGLLAPAQASTMTPTEAQAQIESQAPPSTSTPTSTPTLTLDRVLASADAHHPTIAVALMEQAAARGELLASEGGFDPLLKAQAVGDSSYYLNGTADVGVEVPTPLWGTTFTGGWRLGAGDFPVYDGKLETDDWGEVRIGLLLPLLRDGGIDRRRAGIEKATLEQQVQEQALRLARLEVRRQAALAWWEWVAARGRLDVATDLLGLAEARDAQLRSRVRDGDVAAIEQQDNARLIAQRRARKASARRGLERAALELSLYLRDDDGAPVVVDGDRAAAVNADPADVEGPDELVAEARARRPELLRWRLLQGQVAVDQRVAENQLLPNLGLRAGVSQDLGPTAPPLNPSPTVWNGDKTRDPLDVEVGVVFELPVFLRAGRGRLEVVDAQQRRLDQLARLAGDRVALEVHDALSALRAADARITAADDEVTAARAVEDGERIRFDAGDSTLLVVNLREGATAEARLATVDALLDRRRAETALLAATGRLLE